MIYDIIFTETHLKQLQDAVFPTGGNEGSAYILCGRSKIKYDPWNRISRERFTSFEVIPVPVEDHISSSPEHVTWATKSYVKLLKRAREENLLLGIVHSHPNGFPDFSEQDNTNERNLLQLARNRNGNEANLLSVVFLGPNKLRCRIWDQSPSPTEITRILSIGQNIRFLNKNAFLTDEAFSRQALAFGPELNPILKELMVGIAGGGATGSATAMLLARMGVGQIVLFDNDIVETTNLNRLHGSKRSDASAMRHKVDVIVREIADMGLDTRITSFANWVGNPECRDAIKSCDIIFGCTDDHDGRLFLNRLAYFYLIPVIDMGLAIVPDPAGGVKDITGRITILTPGAPCLLCRGIIDPVTARDEDLKRRSPEEYERRKKEAYIRGAGNPSPAVVTFTTATACMAVDELVQAITNFRKSPGWVWQRIRRFDKMTDHYPGTITNKSCPICVDATFWGLADVEPFLDRIG